MEKKDAMKTLKGFYDKSAPFSIREALDTVIPELKESQDERIKKEIIDIVKSQKEQQCHIDGSVYDKMIAWLERQGEQILANSAKTCKDEQKPADKVEPKFKVGDWVVQEKIGVYKVIEVCESWYEVVDSKDKHYSIGFDKEYMCHLWTIKDAKDGDVLVTPNKNIFIFKNIKGTGIYDYCGFYFRVFHPEDSCVNGTIWSELPNDYLPATKEQRDTLEKAMKDAGWEFDFTKKELMKIEKKLTWSEEDEDLMKWSVDNLTELKDRFGNEYGKVGKCIDWIKSLKQRIRVKV